MLSCFRSRWPGSNALRLLLVVLVLLSATCVPRCRSQCTDPSCYTAPQQTNTYTFLKELATGVGRDPGPSTNFCAWTGVTCATDGVTYSLAWLGISGTLAELSSSLVASDIVVTAIDLSANTRLQCSVPSSWGVLVRLRSLQLN